eukprot:jgi/Bigna1/127834/aug1.5_g2542
MGYKSKVELLHRILLSRELKPYVKSFPTAIIISSMGLVIHRWCYNPAKLGKAMQKFHDYHCGFTTENLRQFREEMKRTGWVKNETARKYIEGFTLRSTHRIAKTFLRVMAIKSIIMMKLPLPIKKHFIQYIRTCLTCVVAYQIAIRMVIIWNNMKSTPPPTWLIKAMFLLPGLAVFLEGGARRVDLAAFFIASQILSFLEERNINSLSFHALSSCVLGYRAFKPRS